MYGLIAQSIPPERIFIATPREHAPHIREQLPHLPAGTIMIEPDARDTGPGLCLATAKIHARDKDAVIATFCADHLVQGEKAFSETISAGIASAKAHPTAMILVGALPTRAHIGLGYIQVGQPVMEVQGKTLFVVDGFIEKPDSEQASALVRSHKYLWNTAYRFFTAKGFLEVARSAAPSVVSACDALLSVQEHAHTAGKRAFSELEKKSFEYLFAAHFSFMVLKADFIWDDIGDWKAYFEALYRNRAHDTRQHILLNSTNSMILGEKNKIIAVVGIHDIIVVDTEDATLIVDRNQARNIKGLVDHIEEKGLQTYL